MSAEARWNAAWAALGAQPPAGLLAELRACYREPHRAYHTLRHVEECFAALAPAASLAERLPEVELAIWFHDAVCDPRAADNEAASARWAEHALREGGVAADAAERVAALVLVTRHHVVPEGRDARLLADVDLAILGAEPARYAEYEHQVRREYDWVPDPAFAEGRARILRAFLARPRIYGTDRFAGQLEARARANLARSLAALART